MSVRFFIIPLFFFFFFVSFYPNLLFSISNNNTDYKALISFKNGLLKQQNSSSSSAATFILNSWGDDNNKHFCSWEGVTCGRKHPDRVIGLDLGSTGLIGPLPSSTSNLTFLRRIDLSNNSLYGEIPPSLSHLPRLQHLNLSVNLFHGDIPALLMTNNSMFRVLCLCCNRLTGKIPNVVVVPSMSQLNHLDLQKNNIIGTIPPSIGNLSFLEILFLQYNQLEGGIPLQICSLRRLELLYVGCNELSENGEGAPPTTSTDVYSFGIILLELLTGRRHTDHIFKDNLNLYNYVRMVFPHRINFIIDLKMFTEEERQANKWSCQNINNCLLSLAEVGLSCSATLPEERPSMREVSTKLRAIRAVNLQINGNIEIS